MAFGARLSHRHAANPRCISSGLVLTRQKRVAIGSAVFQAMLQTRGLAAIKLDDEISFALAEIALSDGPHQRFQFIIHSFNLRGTERTNEHQPTVAFNDFHEIGDRRAKGQAFSARP